MPKHRNPKFPIITLEEAISDLSKILELSRADELNRETLAKVLGFETVSGVAARTIAAFRAYNFVERSSSGLAITSIGEQLANNPNDLVLKQASAISPRIFRKVWRSYRKSTETEQIEFLHSINFTEEGASKAMEIYYANSEFAQLDELLTEPPLPERKSRIRQRQPILFQLPLKNGKFAIVGEIEKNEFDLVIETLQKWRDQIN